MCAGLVDGKVKVCFVQGDKTLDEDETFGLLNQERVLSGAQFFGHARAMIWVETAMNCRSCFKIPSQPQITCKRQ